MKKLKLLVISALLVTLVTGCGMKAEYSIKIGKDKDVKLEFLVAQDNEMIDAMLDMANSGSDSEDKKYTDKDRWAYLEESDEDDDDFKDFKQTKYDKDGYKGYVYTLNLGSIDKLVAKKGEAIDFDSIEKGSKLFTKSGDVYTLNIKSSDENEQQMEQYKNSIDFDVKLKVTLPNKAKSHNATKVDGNTYIWDLTKKKDIKLSFDLNGSSTNSKTMIIIGVGAVAAVAVVAAVVITSTKKKKETSAE